MTKKERLRLNTIHVFEMVKLNFNVTTDFNDEEGHGFFTFGITEIGVEYLFDLQRRDFYVLSHKVRNEKGYEKSIELEKELEEFIKNEIEISNNIIDGLYN